MTYNRHPDDRSGQLPSRDDKDQAVSDTPKTDALLAERRLLEHEDRWDVSDVEAFLRHARQLEREVQDLERKLKAVVVAATGNAMRGIT